LLDGSSNLFIFFIHVYLIKGGCKMAKLTAWLVTLLGALLVLQLVAPATFAGAWFNWLVALAVLAVGLGKLNRNYKKRRK